MNHAGDRNRKEEKAPYIHSYRRDYSPLTRSDRLVVGFAGKPQIGQHCTAAWLYTYLKMERGIRVTRMGFGDRLREVMSALAGNVQWKGGDRLYGTGLLNMEALAEQFRSKFIEPRLGEHFFIDIIADRIQQSGWGVIIIDDLRRQNEFIFIKDIGGVTIRVVDDDTRDNSPMSGNDFDITITRKNNQSGTNMRDEVTGIFEFLQKHNPGLTLMLEWS